jgi:hypothetical protein
MRSIYLALTNNTIDEILPPILRRCIVIQTDLFTDNELMHAAERVKIGGDVTGKEFLIIDRLRDREHESTEPFQSLIPEIDEDVRKKTIENGRKAHERWKSFALFYSEDPGTRTVQTLISYVELVAMGYHLLWQKDMDDIPDERFQRMIKRRSRALGWRSDEQDFGKTPPPLSQLADPSDISTDESF